MPLLGQGTVNLNYCDSYRHADFKLKLNWAVHHLWIGGALAPPSWIAATNRAGPESWNFKVFRTKPKQSRSKLSCLALLR